MQLAVHHGNGEWRMHWSKRSRRGEKMGELHISLYTIWQHRRPMLYMLRSLMM